MAQQVCQFRDFYDVHLPTLGCEEEGDFLDTLPFPIYPYITDKESKYKEK